jgi:hypothetical protein
VFDVTEVTTPNLHQRTGPVPAPTDRFWAAVEVLRWTRALLYAEESRQTGNLTKAIQAARWI